MANFFSLALEIRQQILIEAFRAAAEFDKCAVDRMAYHRNQFRRDKAETEHVSTELVEYACNAVRISEQSKIHIRAELPLATSTTILALTSHLTVYDLRWNLLTVQFTMLNELNWVVSAWAADFTEEEVMRHKSKLMFASRFLRNLAERNDGYICDEVKE